MTEKDQDCKHAECEVSADSLHLYCCDCGQDMDADVDQQTMRPGASPEKGNGNGSDRT